MLRKWSVIMLLLTLISIIVGGCQSGGVPRTNSSSSDHDERIKESAVSSPSPTSAASSQTPNAAPRPKPPVSVGKEAYLTFDDGPSANTGPILETLKVYGIKATFFVNGTENKEEIALYKRISAEGHAIGLHGFSHDYAAVYDSVAAFRTDLDKLSQLLERTIGYKPDILRFPGGSNNTISRKSGGVGIMEKLIELVNRRGYAYFDWNVDGKDAEAPVQDKSTIVRTVLKESEGKEAIIILLHDVDIKKTTVQALPELIETLQKRGYAFKLLNKQSFTVHLK